MKKAFTVRVEGFPNSIVAAESRAKAASVAYRSLLEVGYEYEWAEIKAIRNPQFDEWAKTDSSGHGWDAGILTKIIEQQNNTPINQE